MPVSPGYLESLRDLLDFVPDLAMKRMFGGAGVYSGDRMFGLVADDVLYLKVDAGNRAAFEAEGLSPFVFREKDGREMEMSYWRAPEAVWDDPETARRWASLSLEAALRKARPKSRAKAPKARREPELLISGPWDED